jgi:DNA repair protein RadC
MRKAGLENRRDFDLLLENSSNLCFNRFYNYMNDYKYTGLDRRFEIRDGGAIKSSPFSCAFNPREKLINKGPAFLSDAELLAVVIAGVKGKDVENAVVKLLDRLDQSSNIPDIKELLKISGLSRHKACVMSALLEFGRRRWGGNGTRIRQPEDVFNLIRHFADKRQERFICVSLNGAHEVLAARVVTVGLVNKTIVHPREVFADPLMDRSSAVICAHNHPSGQLAPSPEDDEITERLQNAAEILGVSFLDHIIFSEKSFFSYRQSGSWRDT